jgi:hypothetical protein
MYVTHCDCTFTPISSSGHDHATLILAICTAIITNLCLLCMSDMIAIFDAFYTFPKLSYDTVATNFTWPYPHADSTNSPQVSS